jgi:DNA-binding MarR family transcriptional regulator
MAKTAFQGRAKQIMIRIADNGAMTTTELANNFGVVTQAISAYLRELRAAEFIVTKRHTRNDRRFKANHLTTKGRAYLDNMYDELSHEDRKIWTSEEIDREYGGERDSAAISLREWQRQQDEKILAEYEAEKENGVKNVKNPVLIENENGAFSF